MKMRFKTDNQTYGLVLQRKGFQTKDPFGKGLAMFTVTDEDGDTIGCVSFGASLLNTLTSDNKSKSLLTSSKSELLYVSLLSHLDLDIKQLAKIYEGGSWCVAYFFDSQRETGVSAEDQIYYIKIQNGFYKTIQNLIFNGEITNNKIQRKILEILYNYWEEDSITNILFDDLQLMIPIEFQALYRNLKALEEENKIEIQYSAAIIEYVMGNKIQASTKGNQSPIIIGENINVAFGDIVTEIENKNEENKEDVIKLVNELKNEATTTKDPNKIIGLLGKIKEKASWVNAKILSHLFLSQFFATLLANKMGLM